MPKATKRPRKKTAKQREMERIRWELKCLDQCREQNRKQKEELMERRRDLEEMEEQIYHRGNAVEMEKRQLVVDRLPFRRFEYEVMERQKKIKQREKAVTAGEERLRRQVESYEIDMANQRQRTFSYIS